MATNICIRGGFERFISPPGTSENEEMRLDYWNDTDSETKYHCLDLDSSPEKQQHHQQNHQSPMSVCAGCRLEIVDRYILKVNPNLDFHAHCLKCVECRRPLDENQTAFVKNGQTYCRTDYERLFTTRCTRCSIGFDKTELVMRAGMHVFHMDCFSCVACEKRLQTGEEFQIKNNRLYCRTDCECGNVPDTSSSVPDFKNNNNNINSSNSFDDDSWETSTLTSLDNHTTSPPLSPKSDGMQTPIYGHSGHHQHSSGGSSNSSSGKKKKDKQTTRVRTVLNETQLKILKETYSMNSRPDAMWKEKLVEMTGLSSRVIRVWFQNKRCKDKKRQIQIHESRLNTEREEVLNRVRVSGVGPLIVGAPTAHIDNSLGGPIEITHYPQWVPPSCEVGGPPPPQGPQFGNAMMFGNPMEMSFAPAPHQPHQPSATDPTGASVFPHYSPQHGNVTATSHLIPSPSNCGE